MICMNETGQRHAWLASEESEPGARPERFGVEDDFTTTLREFATRTTWRRP